MDIYETSKLLWNEDSRISFNSELSELPNSLLSYLDLLNNYTADRNFKESGYSNIQEEEITNFISSCTKFLNIIYNNGHYNGTYNNFLIYVKEKWFNLHGFNCLFEHIFLGEYDKNTVQGYHNWIKLKVDLATDSISNFNKLESKNKYFLKFSFNYCGRFKRLNAMLIESTPQYDFAIMTLALLSEKPKIKIYTDDGDLIANIYPKTIFFTEE